MHEAILKTNSSDVRSISKALSIDNIREKNLKITTKFKNDRIVSKVKTNSLRTLINTLDDLLFCQTTAEKILK